MPDNCRKTPKETKNPNEQEEKCFNKSEQIQKSKPNTCKHDNRGESREKVTEGPRKPNRTNLFQPPNFFKRIGPRQIEVFSAFIPSMIVYTIAAALCTVYVCEWRDVLQYVPYYGQIYKKDEKDS